VRDLATIPGDEPTMSDDSHRKDPPPPPVLGRVLPVRDFAQVTLCVQIHIGDTPGEMPPPPVPYQ
jgi:hypothetical protein